MYKYNATLQFNENSSHGMLADRIKPGEKILEFGCSRGDFANYVTEKYGCSVWGIEISEEALEQAKDSLSRAILADIEDYEWEREIGDERFDVIVFSDVLEHLRDPRKALTVSAKYLKNDGRVLFSVPNIAHADIIAKLLQNRFDYTNIGLLDNTHIHFLGLENLEEFCSDSGFVLGEIAATYSPYGATEQGDSIDSSSKRFISQYPGHEIYQFICVAYKADYAETAGIWSVRNLRPEKSFSTIVYFDFGEGFSEENKQIIYDKTPGKIDITLDKLEGVKAVRVDIREFGGYLITNAEFSIDGTRIMPTHLVGASYFDEKFLLLEDDPQLIFPIHDGAKTFCVRADVTSIFDNESAGQRLAEIALRGQELSQELEDSKSNLDATVQKLNEANFNVERTQKVLSEATQKLEDVSERLTKTDGELKRTNDELEKTSHELEKANDSLKKTNDKLEKANDNLEKANEKLEKTSDKLKKTEAELNKTSTKLENTSSQLEQTKNALDNTNAELSHYKEHYFAAIAQREDLKHQLEIARIEYNVISNAGFWKITKPLRVLFDLLKKIPPIRLAYKTLQSLKQYGLKYTLKRIDRKIKAKKAATRVVYTPEDIEKQRKRKFKKKIKISVIVPLYNTPEKFLRAMIESVQKQTYSMWELCLADGSDSKNTDVEKICKEYANSDTRIKYKRLEKNLGISGNTNECIDMATGEYIALFDHDDLLHEAALYEVMKAICNQKADLIYTDENTFHNTPADAFCPNFKPDYSPDTLRSYNYICHLTVFKASLLEKTGKFRSDFDGSQDYDMILRLTEQAKKIVHIPIILYYWRAHKNSVASDISAKPYTLDAAKRALAEHLDRLGLKGTVSDSRIPSTYKIKYDIIGEPLVSIIIPNKDHTDDLDLCIRSVEERSTYRNFEIIVVENNSTEDDTFDYYEKIVKEYENVKVVFWKHEFNYSKINNFGFKYAKGEHIVLLNNDIEILTPSWIEEMLMFTQRKDVGAAGMMLYYSDDTIQHAGVIVGLGGVAGHSHKHYRRGECGYCYRLSLAQNLSAVTAASMMIRSDVFRTISGLDETFAVAFNDVDLCMKIRKAGYLIVWTPYAEAYHYESKSRGYEDTPEKQKRFMGEVNNFIMKWQDFLDAGDPYYNVNLTLDREDFTFKE